jgi:betaine lipid synthase
MHKPRCWNQISISCSYIHCQTGVVGSWTDIKLSHIVVMALRQGASAIDGQILRIAVVFLVLVFFIGLIFFAASRERKRSSSRGSPSALHAYLRFIYSCFLKPHTGDGSHQDALESFYRTQASAYDATRRKLLEGREDLLGLVAAQLKHRKQTGVITRKPVWVDVSDGRTTLIKGQHLLRPRL